MQGPERRLLLDAARVPAERQMRMPITFKVERLARSGGWALLVAQLLDGRKRPINLLRTPLADLARHGVASDTYAALLRREGGGWRVIEHRAGFTDEGWRDWVDEHAAPAALLD